MCACYPGMELCVAVVDEWQKPAWLDGGNCSVWGFWWAGELGIKIGDLFALHTLFALMIVASELRHTFIALQDDNETKIIELHCDNLENFQ